MAGLFAKQSKASSIWAPYWTVDTQSKAKLIILLYITSRSFRPVLKLLKSSCQLEAFTSSTLSYSESLILSKCFLKLSLISARIVSISGPLEPPNLGIQLSFPFPANWSWPSQISVNSVHLQTNASICAKIEFQLNSHFLPSFFFFITSQVFIYMAFHYFPHWIESCKSCIHFSTSPSSISEIFIVALHLFMISLDILCKSPLILSGELQCWEYSEIILTLLRSPNKIGGMSLGDDLSRSLQGSYKELRYAKLFSASLVPVSMFLVVS